MMTKPQITETHELPQVASHVLPADPMVSMIERIAMDPNSDLEKLERMLEMKAKHDADKARGEYAASFAAASALFPKIPKNGSGHNNAKYALLEDIMSLTRPMLSENGLALTFSIDVKDSVVVTAKLMHKAGHVETTSIALPRDTGGAKNAVQAVGSSQTYGQRYTAQAILGLSLGDDTEDDGRGSGKPVVSQKAMGWAETVTADLGDDATPKDKAEAITRALCSQWQRMKGIRQLGLEYDRREPLIAALESQYPAFHETVIDGYERRAEDLRLEAEAKG